MLLTLAVLACAAAAAEGPAAAAVVTKQADFLCPMIIHVHLSSEVENEV